MADSLQPLNNPGVDGYAIFRSDFVVENQAKLIADAHVAHKRFEIARGANKVDSTKGYAYYNLFALTVGSKEFFALHKQIASVIRCVIPDGRELWFQCWLNYHMPDEVLSWHSHEGCMIHGYLSLDPKDTSTNFQTFSVKNEVGKIYVGHSHQQHAVVVHTPYDTPRLTIAFDVVDAETMIDITNRYGFDVNLSYMPI